MAERLSQQGIQAPGALVGTAERSGDPTGGSVERSLEDVRQEWRNHWEERRSHQRYPVGLASACNLQLDRGHFPPMPVQLQDISPGGACLLISSLVDLRRGEMGELRSQLQGDDAARLLDRRRLRVCWQDVRDWITAVGVAFEPPLDALPEAWIAADAGAPSI